MMNIPEISELMIREYAGATNKFGKFNSKHEGLAVIWEEFTELKDEVFLKISDKEKMKHEATQIGAMAMRFIFDICNDEGVK